MAKRKFTSKLTDFAIPISIFHGLSLLAFIPDFIRWSNLLMLLLAVIFVGQGINLGYHRLLTHRSLRVPKWLEYWYVLLALCCMEETPAKWVSTHRKHHAQSDQDLDPHSPKESFIWSHIGWLLFLRDDENSMRYDDRYASDILEDPFYGFLERNFAWFPFLLVGFQIVVVFSISVLVFTWQGSELLTALWPSFGVTVWLVFLRIVIVWHMTWSVNSLSHVFGYRNYETSEQSRNNWLVAIISSGEGWHNNHHHDQASASVQHKWWEFDITYYHIRILEFFGLATDVIRPRHIRQNRSATGKQDAELSD